MLHTAGDIGFILAASGSIVFAILFLASVRWWKDYFGWILAAVLGSVGIIMCLSTVRLLGLPLPGLFWWRAIMFNALGIGIYSGVVLFIRSQFFAPRRRARKKDLGGEDEDS